MSELAATDAQRSREPDRAQRKSGERAAPVQLAERVHLIGIGGAGMSGIARILLARGARGLGFGRQGLPGRARAARARRPGRGRPRPGAPARARRPRWWCPPRSGRPTRSWPPPASAGSTVVHRARALAALTAGRRLAAVTGTAGKTSTTSMLTVALQHCGLDPSFAIGGDLAASGAGAHEGSGDIFVAEADESRRVLPGVLPEGRGGHQRRGRPPRPLRQRRRPTSRRSRRSSDRIVPGGALVTCADDPGAAALAGSGRAARHPGAPLRPRRRHATPG